MTDRKTFFVFTTGCKANQWDSHVLTDKLEHAGLTRVPAECADLVVINACSLTGRAETDARRFIRRARQVNPHALVALVGCHAQAYPGRDFGADSCSVRRKSSRSTGIYRRKAALSHRPACSPWRRLG